MQITHNTRARIMVELKDITEPAQKIKPLKGAKDTEIETH